MTYSPIRLNILITFPLYLVCVYVVVFFSFVVFFLFLFFVSGMVLSVQMLDCILYFILMIFMFVLNVALNKRKHQ